MSPHMRERRRQAMLTQEELADRLGVSVVSVRRWERGEVLPQPEHLRKLCELLQASPDELGLGVDSNALASAGTPTPIPELANASMRASTLDLPAANTPINDPELPPAVRRSQDQWREIRALLTDRTNLYSSVAKLYDPALLVGGSFALTRPEWVMAKPIDIRQLDMSLSIIPRSYPILGAEPEAKLTLPLHSPGHQYDRYSSVIRQLSRPRLFENRLSFRLESYVPERHGNGRPSFEFGIGTYFEKIDVSEVLVHEFAAAYLHRQQQGLDPQPTWDDLPFRALVGDPLDLNRRPILPGVHTLTLRRSASDTTMLLHLRDPSRVAIGGRIYTLIPSGEFQPSSISPASHEIDLDLWRNMVREYSEELLDMPEHDGSQGTTLDYDAWPLYRVLTAALRAGRVRVYYLGMACNPLSLGVDLLTVTVFDAGTFDSAFDSVRKANSEGSVLTSRPDVSSPGLTFAEETISYLLSERRLAPTSAACLSLAWEHRDVLLGG